jgi:hypothetical protein
MKTIFKFFVIATIILSFAKINPKSHANQLGQCSDPLVVFNVHIPNEDKSIIQCLGDKGVVEVLSLPNVYAKLSPDQNYIGYTHSAVEKDHIIPTSVSLYTYGLELGETRLLIKAGQISFEWLTSSELLVATWDGFPRLITEKPSKRYIFDLGSGIWTELEWDLEDAFVDYVVTTDSFLLVNTASGLKLVDRDSNVDPIDLPCNSSDAYFIPLFVAISNDGSLITYKVNCDRADGYLCPVFYNTINQETIIFDSLNYEAKVLFSPSNQFIAFNGNKRLDIYNVNQATFVTEEFTGEIFHLEWLEGQDILLIGLKAEGAISFLSYNILTTQFKELGTVDVGTNNISMIS